MKQLTILLISVMAFGCNSVAQNSDTDMSVEKNKLSYSLGVLMAQNLKSLDADVDPTVLAEAINDVLKGNDLKVEAAEAQQFFQEFSKAQSAKKFEKNKSEGETFLAENAKKEGVVVLPSGLQYKVITDGTGAKPAATDKVTVHYHGTLIDGTVFDSSVDRGTPASFPVNGVIKGWVEALQLMPTGSKWQLYIPSDLAYGERGAGGDIGPFATLIFDVELISID